MDSQDTALIFDRRAETRGLPGTHALIVGISRYAHLPLKPSSGSPDELVPVTFAARSAATFADWIVRHHERLEVPLATCRVLLAPSLEEVEDLRRLGQQAAPCDVGNFMSVVAAWQRDSLENKDSLLVLYFAGHALELRKEHPLLVFEDFGAPFGPTLRATVRLSNLVAGLSPSAWQMNVARRQFFFIDTDRIETVADQIRSTEIVPGSTAVFDVPRVSEFDDRRYCVLYATSPGGEAYAIHNYTTMFNIALMRCLNGAAAVSGPPGPDGSIPWYVTTRSLVRGIQIVLDDLNDTYRQRVAWSVRGDDATLVRFAGPPTAELRLQIRPPALLPQLDIQLYNDRSEMVSESDRSDVRDELAQVIWKLPAGLYRLRMSNRATEKTREQLVSVEAPRSEIILEIEP